MLLKVPKSKYSSSIIPNADQLIDIISIDQYSTNSREAKRKKKKRNKSQTPLSPFHCPRIDSKAKAIKIN
jgi:hypothetical protein